MFRRPTTSAVRTFDIHIVCGRRFDGGNKKSVSAKCSAGNYLSFGRKIVKFKFHTELSILFSNRDQIRFVSPPPDDATIHALWVTSCGFLSWII